jgi:hypothetical protein
MANKKLGKKVCQRFGKPNVRYWQTSVANQMVAKVLAYPHFGNAILSINQPGPKIIELILLNSLLKTLPRYVPFFESRYFHRNH